MLNTTERFQEWHSTHTYLDLEDVGRYDAGDCGWDDLCNGRTPASNESPFGEEGAGGVVNRRVYHLPGLRAGQPSSYSQRYAVL